MLEHKITTRFRVLRGLIKVISLLWLSLWLIACQTPPLQVYYAMNNELDLTAYQTFTIQIATNSESQYLDYINKGIIASLSAKGYHSTQQADLIVRYSLHFKADERLQLECIPQQGTLHTTTSMEAVFEAKMLVNIIDTRTDNIIWKAATTRDLSSVNLEKVNQESINKRIEELFESFPAR